MVFLLVLVTFDVMELKLIWLKVVLELMDFSKYRVNHHVWCPVTGARTGDY